MTWGSSAAGDVLVRRKTGHGKLMLHRPVTAGGLGALHLSDDWAGPDGRPRPGQTGTSSTAPTA